jgi:hypothetical protein
MVFSAWSDVVSVSGPVRFVFAATTHRRWAQYASGLAAHIRRVRRCAALLGLGYLLHLPTNSVADLRFIGDEAWRGFPAVDILQCIAASLGVLHILVILARTPTRFAFAAAIACVCVVIATPAVWRNEALDRVPLAISSYLSGHSGSLFPFFPWASYMLLGAMLGERYQHAVFTPRSFANRLLLPGGLLMVTTSLVCKQLPSCAKTRPRPDLRRHCPVEAVGGSFA